MVGLMMGNRLVTPHRGLEFLTRSKGSHEVDVSSPFSAIQGSPAEGLLLDALSSMESSLSEFNTREHHLAPIAKQSCDIASLPNMAEEDRVQRGSKSHSSIINALLELLTKTGVSEAVHARALSVFMELVRSETPGTFSNALYRKLCSALLSSKGPIAKVVGVLESQYFQYADVRYFTSVNIQKLAIEQFSAKGDDIMGQLSLQMFVRNLYEILSHLPSTLKGDSGKEGFLNKSADKTWCSALSMTMMRDTGSEVNCETSAKWSDKLIQKGAFLKSWEAFTKLCQSLSTLQRNCGDTLSQFLSPQRRSTAGATRDSFLSSLADDVDERLIQLAACKESTANAVESYSGTQCGRNFETSEWVISAARGSADDDDDDDDDDEDGDEDDDDDEEDDGTKAEGGEDEEDVEGEEDEGEDDEGDEDGDGDDNGEDEDGEEDDGEDDDGDEDGDEDQEDEDDEDGDHDEDEDEDDAEGESDEDVEPPKKRRK